MKNTAVTKMPSSWILMDLLAYMGKAFVGLGVLL